MAKTLRQLRNYLYFNYYSILNQATHSAITLRAEKMITLLRDERIGCYFIVRIRRLTDLKIIFTIFYALFTTFPQTTSKSVSLI